MRATLGQIVLIALVSTGICGCRGGSNMFAWGRKKPSDESVNEAPKFAGDPQLPSAGQTPGKAPTDVTSPASLGTPSYGTPSYNSSTPSPYAAQAASYQQSSYPTTPHAPAQIGGGSDTNNAAAASPGNGGNNAGSAPGYTAGGPAPGGFGNPPASTPQYGSGNAAATTQPPQYGATTIAPAGNTQPQVGSYNPTYPANGAATTPSYAGAGANSSDSFTGIAGAPASSTSPGVSPPDYRTADARSALNETSSGTGAAPTGKLPGNTASASADNRYGGTIDTSVVGDRYANQANPPVDAAANGATAGDAGDRYGPSAGGSPLGNTGLGDTGHPPGGTTNPANTTGYSSSNDNLTPSTSGTESATPERPDPGYRPGGTSSFTPLSNRLHNNLDNGLRDGRDDNEPESRPQSGVTPASYDDTAGPGEVTQAGGLAPASSSFETSGDEVYGSYQGASAAAQPAGGVPNSAAAPGLFHGHSW